MSTPNVAARFDHSPGSPRRILDHYAKHSPFSDPGRHAALLRVRTCSDVSP